MAGFRTFATGEVLTAANVNDFLMKQSVMVFADDAARTAALGAETVEGMLTFNKDTGQLEVFDGTNFVIAAPEPPAGIGSNVVSTVETEVFSTASNTYVTLSGLTLSFTPTSATSKVLLMWTVPVSGLVNDTSRNNQMAPFRDGTNLLVPTSPGSRSIALMARNLNGLTAAVSELELYSGFFLDSPATTSAVTYDMRGRVNNSGITFLMNRTSNDANASTFARSVASLVAIEVAA